MLKILFNLGLNLILVVSVSASETIKGAKKDIEAFKAEMSQKLEAIDKRIVELREKAKAEGKEVKEDSIKEFETAKAKLKSDLDGLESASKSNWKKFKKNFGDALNSLNSKMQKALKD